MSATLIFILTQFLHSELFTMVLAGIGAWLVTKFPAVAKVLKAAANSDLQAIADRIYEEIKLRWASNGKVVQTAEDVHQLIEQIVSVLKKLFPKVSEEKLRSMATASVASPNTSSVTDPVVPFEKPTIDSPTETQPQADLDTQ